MSRYTHVITFTQLQSSNYTHSFTDAVPQRTGIISTAQTLGFWHERLTLDLGFFCKKEMEEGELNGILSPRGTAKAERC